MGKPTKVSDRNAPWYRPKIKRQYRNRAFRKYFLIVCEGTRTEPNYFVAISKALPLNVIELDIQGEGANTLVWSKGLGKLGIVELKVVILLMRYGLYLIRTAFHLIILTMQLPTLKQTKYTALGPTRHLNSGIFYILNIATPE